MVLVTVIMPARVTEPAAHSSIARVATDFLLDVVLIFVRLLLS